MKPTKKRNWAAMNKVARLLGLKHLENGKYLMPSGKTVDLGATAPERWAVLYTIGLQSLA